MWISVACSSSARAAPRVDFPLALPPSMATKKGFLFSLRCSISRFSRDTRCSMDPPPFLTK